MNNRVFFNSVADSWDSMIFHDEGKINKILNTVSIEKGKTALDVGTGTGIIIPFLHGLLGDSGRIYAVDIAERMIENAKKKYSYQNVEYFVGDVLEINLPECYFDYILCYSMFPHFSDKKEAIVKLSKYLAKGGKLVICHSQSRKAINDLHKEASETVRNDRLPAADIIKEYFIYAGIEPTTVIDNEDMFVVVGQKPI